MQRHDEWESPADEAIDLERLSASLLICACVATPIAAIAVRWPDPALVLAMVASGGVIGTFGIFDLAAALVSGTVPSVRAFFLGHGLASIGFGLLTATIPVASAGNARLLAIYWLTLYAIFLALLTWRLWYHPHARYPLIAWCILNAVLATALRASSPLSTADLLYGAAAYTCVLGVCMLAAGLSMHHDLARRTTAPRAARTT